MIPNETPQTLDTIGQGVRIVGNFKITDATQARILVSLSDKMYTRKELAFIREYSTNAADAHIVAKKPISEILVDLPTMDNLNFRIRDFGSGLSEEQISTVYCVFGESTKRNSNDQNGLLGYGCKAGFAHADSFTVTSWYNGEKSIYQCVKGDSTKLHSAILLSRCSSDEPSGIEVVIPVKQSSLWTVHREAADFYKYWSSIPVISNMAAADLTRMNNFRNMPATLKGNGWEVRPKSSANATAVAYMGGVPYTIDWNILYSRLALTSEKRVLFELLRSNDVTLLFDMGQVQFVDSREHLEYTDLTLDAVTKKIEEIFSKIQEAFQNIFSNATNLWEAKKLYSKVFGYTKGKSNEEDEENELLTERIRILDGSLENIELTFKESFTWNNINIFGPSFNLLNKFDNAYFNEICHGEHSPISPVLVTYRRKNLRVKTLRCNSQKNNMITAADNVAVVINDTGKKSGLSTIARHLIIGMNFRKVYFLSFDNDTIKENFYKYYNFYTVPTMTASTLLPAAKSWLAINKGSRTSSGGVGGSRVMKYMDIDNQSINENEVPIREMEEGGYFIETGEGRKECRFVVSHNGYELLPPSKVVNSLWILKDKAGLDIDKVFIVNRQTKQSKWFQRAIASGEWKSIWAYLDDCELDIDIPSVIDAYNLKEEGLFCNLFANRLIGKLKDTNTLMYKVITLLTSKDFLPNVDISEALDTLKWWSKFGLNRTGSFDINSINAQLTTQYPMLFDHYYHQLNVGTDHYCQSEVMNKIIRYINVMDCYIELTSSIETPTIDKINA